MKVVSVVGARPQFVKLAPVARAMADANVEHVVVDTGQHYDSSMSSALFADFHLEPSRYELGVGSGSHASQTGQMLVAIEDVLVRERPDWVLIYGDTNSTIAAALAAVKLGRPLAHLEAGLRSFNRAMPEEHNRVLADHAADLLLAPTALAADNLAAEGLAHRTVVVGDVMADICLTVAESVDSAPPMDLPKRAGAYVLATLHRPYNTDDPARLQALVTALSEVPLPVVLPVHPRLAAKAQLAGIDLSAGSLQPVDPLPYSSLIYLAKHSRAIVTDSGGLQKEAYLLGVPCTTVRTETEWVETLEGGWNVLVFAPLDQLSSLALRPIPESPRTPQYGTGHAAQAVVAQLMSHHA